MSAYPNVLRNNNKIEIALSPYGECPKYVDVEFILDLNRFRNILGIEILNLKAEVGGRCLEKIESSIDSTGDGLRYSYDEETDSFYLQISSESSSDQKAVDGVLVLSEQGQVLGFKAELDG